jgi:putative O-methyltransferase
VYLGFGSVYYVDFVMFHKYLFIEEMICVEWGDVAKRMRFNKPFKFIQLKLGALFNHIPSMRPSKKYLVWLDYDRSLDLEILQDVDGCLNRMASGSVFIITVDARPKLPKDQIDFENWAVEEQDKLTAKTYQDWFGVYAGKEISVDTISRIHVAPLFYEVLLERIRQTLTTRGGGLRFLQIFNYVYRDGAPMLTVGGIVGTDEDEQNLMTADIPNHRFVRTGRDALEISLPPLTFREKQWLDAHLDARFSSKRLRFELDEELLNNYRKFYKEYPTYMEAFL